MSKRNTSKMTEYNKERSHKKEQAVIDAINKLKKGNSTISLSDICKEAGCSRQFIYNNEKLLKLVNQYRDVDTKKKVQSRDSKDVLILTLKAENTQLRKQIKTLQEETNFKEKYDELKEENEALKKQLEQAYLQKLDVDF